MVEEYPQLVDLRGAIAERLTSPRDVIALLAATGIGAVGRGDIGEGSAAAVVRHPPQRVAQGWIPVAIAPVDRQGRTVGLQSPHERRDQGTVLLIQRADAAKVLVVL